MTIGQAIDRIDEMYPNHFETATKIAWLSELDGKVHTEILKSHVGDVADFSGYSLESDPDTVLLIPFPYDNVYHRYLEMMITQEYKEIERYNQAAALYNAAYLEFANFYNRSHMPLDSGAFKF